MRPLATTLLLAALFLVPVAPAKAQGSADGLLIAGRTEADWREDLQNPQPIVRQAALEALAQFSALSEGTVLGLLPLLGDPDIGVRRTAIRAIGHAPARAIRRARPALWRAWHDEDALVSADAGIALVHGGSDAVREFIAVLERGAPRDRARAAAALANGDDDARTAIHPLRDRLADRDPRVRSAALSALDALDATPGKRTATLVGRALARELMDSPELASPDAIARGRLSLLLLARARNDARNAARPLQLILWDGPAPLRPQAAEVLGTIRGVGDDALAAALAGGDAFVREAAMKGLLADRDRRRPMRAIVDTLRAMRVNDDTLRARQLVDALGLVAKRDRHLDRTLSSLLRSAPFLAPAIQVARRRLALGL